MRRSIEKGFPWGSGVLFALALSACSYQSLYESSVSQRVEACRELRTAEREICERRARRPYAQYAQEREQALGGEQ